jgi:hypothetical protein
MNNTIDLSAGRLLADCYLHGLEKVRKGPALIETHPPCHVQAIFFKLNFQMRVFSATNIYFLVLTPFFKNLSR